MTDRATRREIVRRARKRAKVVAACFDRTAMCVPLAVAVCHEAYCRARRYRDVVKVTISVAGHKIARRYELQEGG